MKLEYGEYCRRVSKKNNTLVITIPSPLVKKMKIDVDQPMRVSEEDGSLVYMDIKSEGRCRRNQTLETRSRSRTRRQNMAGNT